MEDYYEKRGANRVSKTYGLRKVTLGLRRAEKTAELLKDTELPPRYAVKHAVNILRAENLLSAADAETLNTLIDFCGTWETDNNAIVFASNPRIRSRLCGVNSDRALRARLSKLGKLGLISHVERPGSKRGVEIDPFTGNKIYFGISLLPLVAAIPHATELETKRENHYSHKAALIRSISVCATRIKSNVQVILDLDPEGLFWIDALKQAELSLKKAKNEHTIETIKSIDTEINMLLKETSLYVDSLLTTEAENSPELSTETVLVIDDSSVNRSPYPESIVPPDSLNKERTDKSEQCYGRPIARRPSRPKTIAARSLDRSTLKIENRCIESDGSAKDRVNRDLEKYRIKPEQLVTISEGLHAYLPLGSEDNPTWNDVAAAAFALAPIIGITQGAWNKAVQILGVSGAVTAMAVATADANRSRITNSSASYIVWMASQIEQRKEIGMAAKVYSAMNRHEEIVH